MQNSYKLARETGSAAISYTLTMTQDVLWEEFNIHLSAAGGAGTLTITLDANAGAVYDVVLFSQSMVAETDVIYRPERPRALVAGDKLVIAWANANSRTYGLELQWR